MSPINLGDRKGRVFYYIKEVVLCCIQLDEGAWVGSSTGLAEFLIDNNKKVRNYDVKKNKAKIQHPNKKHTSYYNYLQNIFYQMFNSQHIGIYLDIFLLVLLMLVLLKQLIRFVKVVQLGHYSIYLYTN